MPQKTGGNSPHLQLTGRYSRYVRYKHQYPLLWCLVMPHMPRHATGAGACRGMPGHAGSCRVMPGHAVPGHATARAQAGCIRLSDMPACPLHRALCFPNRRICRLYRSPLAGEQTEQNNGQVYMSLNPVSPNRSTALHSLLLHIAGRGTARAARACAARPAARSTEHVRHTRCATRCEQSTSVSILRNSCTPRASARREVVQAVLSIGASS